jgi:cbb3-type cytochrome oxidase subunit 3
MKIGSDEMTLHLARIGGLIVLLVLCTFYPFLPGEYDGLAVPLSALAQTFGMVGLLLVPVGVLWLAYELRKRARRKRNLPTKARGSYFALASMVASSIVAIAVSLGAFMGMSLSLGFLTLALWLYIVLRLMPRLKLLKKAEAENLNPAPLYLVFIPSVVFILQITLAAPAREFSRNRAIAQSAELMKDIEEFHTRHGRYPSFLQAVNKDYHPSVVGIEQFHYAPNGDAYNLFFEQPTFLFDFGIREIVMYNKLDEHLMMSHAAWILTGASEELEARQGWHTVHKASSPHWKYFWFD